MTAVEGAPLFTETPDWTGAACKGHDTEKVFFPEFSFGRSQKKVQRAKAICNGCPLRSACLDYAIRWGITSGIFGGCTFEERVQIDQDRRRQAGAAW